MVPDTRYAILGLLLRQPSHGYQLAVRFGELFGPGWEINRGQVYDMVHTLEDRGLVERLPGRETARRSQRYRATDEGARVFTDWLAAPSSRPNRHRDTLYLKIALAGPNDASLLLDSIAVQEQACVDRLRAYADAPRSAPNDAGDWDALARELIDEATSTQLHAELEWLAKMRARINGLLERSHGQTGIGVEEISARAKSPEGSLAHRQVRLTQLRALALAALVGSLAPLPTATTAMARSVHRAAIAVPSRVISVRDSAKLHSTHVTGATLTEAGYATGTLPGSVRATITIDTTHDRATATITIQLHGGSISARAAGSAHPGKAPWESFSGSASHLHGTGRYAHANGSATVYGAIDRQNDRIEVQVVGQLHV